MKPGDIVKYSRPHKDEIDLRFTLLRIDKGRCDIELICDWAIKPIETVEAGEIEPAFPQDDESDPRQCERCGETITGGIHCFGKYLFLCGGCAAKLEREATPLKLPSLRLPPIRAYKFNPHIEVL